MRLEARLYSGMSRIGHGMSIRTAATGRRLARLVGGPAIHRIGVVAVALAAAGAASAQQGHTIGNAIAVHGDVLVMSHGDMAPKTLAEGDQVFEGDHIETGKGARVRLLLEDGSLVQVGGASVIDLEWVLYAPALDSRNVILSMPGGVVRFVVEQLVPRSSFEVKTQTAITSAQATDWIISARPEATAVLALDGEILVENVRPDVVGSVHLGPGWGTLVKPGEPPADAKNWPADRREAYIRRTELP